MDELLLRTNRTGVKMKHNSMNVSVIPIKLKMNNGSGKHEFYEKLVIAATGDEQFKVVQSIISTYQEFADSEVLLAQVYIKAPLKHPIKSIITKFVNKTLDIQHLFGMHLRKEIEDDLCLEANYKTYSNMITVLTGCLQNFPTGAKVIKELETKLIIYLKNMLQYCVTDIRNPEISPGSRTEVYGTMHSGLNVLHHVIQKLDDKSTVSSKDFLSIEDTIKLIVDEEEAPMDTKSLCGIVLLAIHVYKNGADAWIHALDNETKTASDTERLILLGAIVTSTPTHQLESKLHRGRPVIVALAEDFLKIGLSNATNAAINVSAARGMLQVSRCVSRVASASTADEVVQCALRLAWTQLEHSADNVKHLAQSMLVCAADYCLVRNPEAKERLFDQLQSLDRQKRAFYLTLSSVATHIPAQELFQRMPDLLQILLEALASQPLQSCAKSCLELVLEKHSRSLDVESVSQQWVLPILQHIHDRRPPPIVLAVLNGLIVKAVKQDGQLVQYIMPSITKAESNLDSMGEGEITSLLLLLKAANVKPLPYKLLTATAEHSSVEIGVLTLSLIVDSQKNTQSLTPDDFYLLFHHLEHHIGDCDPNTRHLTLANVKKFMNRYSESYRVLLRQSSPLIAEYLRLLHVLRCKCFGWLFPGANVGRRQASLQILAWSEELDVEYDRQWHHKDVMKVAQCLADNFDSNKKLALQIMESVPKDMLLEVCTKLDILPERSLLLAATERPQQCSTSAHSLLVFSRILPDAVVKANKTIEDAATYALLLDIVVRLRRGLDSTPHCGTAASSAPMYGLVHCARVLFEHADVSKISSDPCWTELIATLIELCQRINEVVMPVVAHCSPEGLILPQQFAKHGSDDHKEIVFEAELNSGEEIHGNNVNSVLDNDYSSPVIENYQNLAQMLLLCAWRCIKETSLFLGSVCQRLPISEEGSTGGLVGSQLISVAEHLGSVLERARHRGAFEQAHVGFCMVVGRMWSSSLPTLREWPRARVSRLLHIVRNAQLHTASRRSAGLPYMLQALVTTELQSTGNSRTFTSCMDQLLALASEEDHLPALESNIEVHVQREDTEEHSSKPERSPQELRNETRAHSLNVLRAMYRNTTLGEVVTERIEEGLMVAIKAFDADNWKVRNSATLLFSTLMVRIFGVMRSRDDETLDVRNRMTGRIFFLRYPRLFDFMLDRLSRSDEVRCDVTANSPRCSVITILLVLGRLYPSSLEGTSTNLKVVQFIPSVTVCAASRQLRTRSLAAKALVPLVASDQFVPHLVGLFDILCEEYVNTNLMHGILLQIKHLMESREEPLSNDACGVFSSRLTRSCNILRTRCCPVLNTYYDILLIVLIKFPLLLDQSTLVAIKLSVETLLFGDSHIEHRAIGRELCEASALRLCLLLTVKDPLQNADVTIRALKHHTYDVIYTILEYVEFLKDLDDEYTNPSFYEYLNKISDKKRILDALRQKQYLMSVNEITKHCTLKDVKSKALKISSVHLSDYISDSKVTSKCISEHLSYIDVDSPYASIYLYRMLKMVKQHLNQVGSQMLSVIKVLYDNCMSESEFECKLEVAKFLEGSLTDLSRHTWEGVDHKDILWYRGMLWCVVAALLSDEDAEVRDLAARAVTARAGKLPSWAMMQVPDLIVESSRDTEEATSLLLVVALHDFRAEVQLDNEDEDGRVFDPSERYNVHLEESLWSGVIAERLQLLHADRATLRQNVSQSITQHECVFHSLVKNNFASLKNELSGIETHTVRVKYFVEKLGLL